VRGAIVLLAGLALATPATAAPPVVTAVATPASGVAPLRVQLRAGDAAGHTWELGDGTGVAGPTVTHVYPAGRFAAIVTGTNATGEVLQAHAEIVVALRPELRASLPPLAPVGGAWTLQSRLVPAGAGLLRVYRDGRLVRTRAGRIPTAAPGAVRIELTPRA
jgi:hypothetical protein